MPNPFILAEHIVDYTFRENGAIFIPKAYRKRAVIMQIDIKIVSVLRELFQNYESSPSEGYYGYATLVMRDFCPPPIKLSQPRQTVFYHRLENAIVNWKNYIDQIRIQENFLGVESLVCEVIGQLNGSCAEKPCVPLVPPSWEEVPLREVYVNTHYGTQFQIEFSYIDMNDVVDNCGNYIRAESGWVDGDKDSGFPPNGVAPAKASDPNNPYVGLPPTSTDELGLLLPSKQENLDDVNPDNLPADPNEIPDGKSYWVRMAGYYSDFANGCQRVDFNQYFSLRFYGETVRALTDSFVDDSCGGILVTSGRIVSNLDDFQYGASTGSGQYVATYQSSETLDNPFI